MSPCFLFFVGCAQRGVRGRTGGDGVGETSKFCWVGGELCKEGGDGVGTEGFRGTTAKEGEEYGRGEGIEEIITGAGVLEGEGRGSVKDGGTWKQKEGWKDELREEEGEGRGEERGSSPNKNALRGSSSIACPTGGCVR
jgi:hypothetical protein